MYAFGIVALLGLAVLAVARVANRYLSLASEVWAFVLVALGVGAAWLINLNLFAVWSIPVRNSAIAVTADGHPDRRGGVLLALGAGVVHQPVAQVHRPGPDHREGRAPAPRRLTRHGPCLAGLPPGRPG